MSSFFTITTALRTYRVEPSDDENLIRRDAPAGKVRCPWDTTMFELDVFKGELDRVDSWQTPVQFQPVPLVGGVN